MSQLIADEALRQARERVDAALHNAAAARTARHIGTVRQSVGLAIDVRGVPAAIGDLVRIEPEIFAEVVAVKEDSVRCMPLSHPTGLKSGARAHSAGALRVPVGGALIGRVINALGEPIDGNGPLTGTTPVPVDAAPPPALSRRRVDQPLPLGVRVLDTLVPAGRGQRFGLFAGSGVGKSSLLSMIARGTEAPVVVLALVGERGREVREFLEDDLGAAGLARSVVVVATSDEPALLRLRAASTATRIAEYFRDQGRDVVLMMDSLTRVAMAQREIGLSVGEPPATRGYPPSTFSMLPRLLERAGPGAHGSITGIYTVLVDGDDHDEPVADAARSILDGHVVLSRRLATAGHFPSIDALESVSRVASRVTSPAQQASGRALRAVLAARREVADLLDVGAYAAGSNRLVDAALQHEERINGFLRQGLDEGCTAEESWQRLAALTQQLEATS
ncbi:MAG: EscN/YscN/HrcN family type III secretion system ATPase [Micrococcales bacterium]|nr:MAG: EscN/YscN/HrcN family type III secretion system ATPase [Micrococcales bacterium]PIE27208.1 MAG: EscN/YscN/HrcN family type III secretion system ATPase [Micrococcales bacterium]